MDGAEEGRLVVGLGGRGAMPAGLLNGGAVVAMIKLKFCVRFTVVIKIYQNQNARYSMSS